MSWRNDPVTEKQLQFIDRRRENAGMNGAIPLPVFRGKTKGEAFDYIDENIGKQFISFDASSHGDNYGDRM